MGTSTDAHLWWGYNDESGQEDGIPEYVIEHLKAHPIDHPKFEFNPDDPSELENVLYYVLQDYGVELVGHCSGEYRMYGLAVSASHVYAHRGYPKQVSTPDPTEEWKATFKRAAELLGWPTDKPPGWWMASYWG